MITVAYDTYVLLTSHQYKSLLKFREKYHCIAIHGHTRPSKQHRPLRELQASYAIGKSKPKTTKEIESLFKINLINACRKFIFMTCSTIQLIKVHDHELTSSHCIALTVVRSKLK